MIVYLYRWKLKAGKEQEFEKAWSYVTNELREKCKSLGSRLHRGSDGLFYGYGQWPSAEARSKATLSHPEIEKAREIMKEATLETLPEITLEPISDYIIQRRKKNR